MWAAPTQIPLLCYWLTGRLVYMAWGIAVYSFSLLRESTGTGSASGYVLMSQFMLIHQTHVSPKCIASLPDGAGCSAVCV